MPLDLLPPAAIPLAVFLLRATDLTLSTLRMLATVRGRRAVAWVLGFIGALLFVTAIVGVLTTLSSGWSLLAYAAGYATGSWVGMTIERRLAPGRSLLRVFTSGSGQAVAEALRAAGQGATWITAQAPGGDLVLCYAPRRSVPALTRVIAGADPECSVTSENVRWLRGGWRVRSPAERRGAARRSPFPIARSPSRRYDCRGGTPRV